MLFPHLVLDFLKANLTEKFVLTRSPNSTWKKSVDVTQRLYPPGPRKMGWDGNTVGIHSAVCSRPEVESVLLPVSFSFQETRFTMHEGRSGTDFLLGTTPNMASTARTTPLIPTTLNLPDIINSKKVLV